VALALARAECGAAAPGDPCWLSLTEGFFVPLDDVPDLRPPRESSDDAYSGARADLLYISASGKAGLCLRFVEVKYRRHAQLARSLDLLQSATQQTATSRRVWCNWYFGPSVPDVTRTLRRSRLARALRFYAEKAHRHHLTTEMFSRLVREIDRLLTKGSDYELIEVSDPDRVYIFCPEQTAALPERLYASDIQDVRIFLFGPANLPDRAAEVDASSTGSQDKPTSFDAASGEQTTESPPDVDPATPGLSDQGDAPIVLGATLGGEPVRWTVSIKGNPHLMVVGLPGMGKTTTLVNICDQLRTAGIAPIVFSYHDDIDAKLADVLDDIRSIDVGSLGFNPMRVATPSSMGHIESAGMLRDVFAAIFPELGDLQLESLRGAVKSSYEDIGWIAPGGAATPSIPPFRAFVQKLRCQPKPEKGVQTLLSRLTELDDYGFFAEGDDEGGLLAARRPVILRLHATRNEALQRACAAFAFYRIYQDMFARGRQDWITHAVVFDEAHRASRLKLLPTMAKECRKFGVALVLASQEAKDFDTSLFSAIANYLVLRVTEHDARTLAKNVAPSDIERRIADRLKLIEKYQALYFCEGRRAPTHVMLSVGGGASRAL
jgi:hypothetical protein